MIYAYIDRFEEDVAVLLLGDEMKKLHFPKAYLPDGLHEGDYITMDIRFDPETTEKAEQEALDLLKD